MIYAALVYGVATMFFWIAFLFVLGSIRWYGQARKATSEKERNDCKGKCLGALLLAAFFMSLAAWTIHLGGLS